MIWKNIIHVAESIFVEGASTPSVSPETLANVLIAKQIFLDRTDEERIGQMMKRVEVNDSGAICELAQYYYRGRGGLIHDQEKGIELLIRAAELGSSRANSCLGVIYYERGDLKKAKFHTEAAAMAGDEMARCNLATIECLSGNNERAVKHYKIAASAGQHFAMHRLRQFFENGHVGRDEIDSTLIAYNNSCAEMRSESRDAYIRESARTHNLITK
jgi:hypothetical protein